MSLIKIREFAKFHDGIRGRRYLTCPFLATINTHCTADFTLTCLQVGMCLAEGEFAGLLSYRALGNSCHTWERAYLNVSGLWFHLISKGNVKKLCGIVKVCSPDVAWGFEEKLLSWTVSALGK